MTIRIRNGQRMTLGTTVIVPAVTVLDQTYPAHVFPKETMVTVQHYRYEVGDDGSLRESARLIRVETDDGQVVHVYAAELTIPP